jgi:hypothetical protein
MVLTADTSPIAATLAAEAAQEKEHKLAKERDAGLPPRYYL